MVQEATSEGESSLQNKFQKGEMGNGGIWLY